jgi:acetolactate synthase small subunit
LFAEVVDEIEPVGLSGTFRILASSGYCSLASSGLDIEVLVVGAAETGIEATIALVVVSADIVDEVESIIESDTAGILAAIRYTSLALAGLNIEILVVGACIERVDSISTLVVVATPVVDQVESVGLADTDRVLAAWGDLSLANSSLKVVVLVGQAVVSSVESVLTLVVGLAEVVDQVESVGNVVTFRILASCWDGVLASSELKVEVLGATARQTAVETIATLEV